MILRGKGGIQYNLAPTPFAQGGEGQIFNINGMPDKVAKLYKAGKITADHERKLIKMVMTPPDQDVLSQIAWPLDVLYDNGTFVGFIMHKFKLNEDLNVIYEYGSSAKYPEMTWGNKIRIAKNLCVVLNAVHEAGHVCGDFNPKNISVDPNTGHITFVDTDSYHITDGNNIYRCNVGMPEYLPREIQIKMHNGLANASLPTFSQATDNFALAVHIFQLLMNGVHPFACAVIPSQDSVPIPSTSDSILNGECPFFKNVPGKQIPKFAPSADILPQEIKRLFMLAFVEGHASPSARPSAETWYYALERLEKNLKPCRDVGHHEYHNSLSACPWCEADQRFSGALSSAKSGGLKQSTFSPPVAPPPTRSTYTPPTTRNPSYTPSPGSVSSSGTSGSSSPSYVGASSYGTTTTKKKGSFTKKLIFGIIAAAIIAVLFGVVVYPNMPNKDLKTPEIVQTYSGTYQVGRYGTKGEAIVTITSCNASGGINGYFEFIADGVYGKYEISGQIISKKNNGNLTVAINPGQWVIQPDDFDPLETFEAEISDKFQTFECSKYSMYWGAGENDKYVIKTAEDLKKLAGSSATYQLKNDIDLINSNWTPISGFTGTLLGNGYCIKNLNINASSSNVGLFSTLEGSVMNLQIENASVTVSGRNENVGILCGELKGSVIDVVVSGKVSAEKSANVGGVCGYVSTKGACVLSDITNNASVTGLSCVGGCFGKVYDYVSNGINEYSLVFSNVKNTGAIVATEDYVAGIVAFVEAEATGYGGGVSTSFIDCANSGSVSGNYYVAGIVGYADSDNDSIIDSCSNAAPIRAQAYTGCIAAVTGNFVIVNCSNEGSTLTATGYYLDEGKKYAYVGGIVGQGTCLENCTNYIDIEYNGGGDFVGGLMGYCNLGPAITGASLWSDTADASFKNLTNKGNISGNSYVGGVIGGTMYFWDNGCTRVTATFEKMSNTGKVVATGDYAGGIAGYMAGDVGGMGGGLSWCFYDSINEAPITGSSNVGGLFGGFRNGKVNGSAYAKNTVTIDGCRSTGSVSGDSNCDDIIGFDDIKR